MQKKLIPCLSNHSQNHGMFLRTYERRDRSRSGAPLLFIHGLGESGLCFERLVTLDAFATHRCLVPDLPGYGRSVWPKEPFTLGRAAELLIDLIKHVDIGPVVVVGHSMGGVVALDFAQKAPALARAVIDVDGNKTEADCTFSGRAAAMAIEDFVVPGGGFDAMRADIFRDAQDDEALRGYYASLRLADPCLFYAHSCELVARSRARTLAADLAALPKPKAYIAGAPKGASPGSLDMLRQAGVPIAEISPAGHWPFIDQPENFAEKLTDILTTLRV